MKYRFILTYQATDSETTATRTCFPLHGDDLSISIDRAEGEWYYTRNLDGKLVFTGDDYDWIMGQEFDGTFTLNIKESHDNGATFYDYFTGTFSRASLEIDQDNHQATLNGLKEGVEDLIKNGKSEDYDLMKLIPDGEAKEVQGEVHPALAMVDLRAESVSHTDIFCGTHFVAAGYKAGVSTGWNQYWNMTEDVMPWLSMGVYADARVVMTDHVSQAEGYYCGKVNYGPNTVNHYTVNSVSGNIESNGSYYLQILVRKDAQGLWANVYVRDGETNPPVASGEILLGYDSSGYYSPQSFVFKDGAPGVTSISGCEKIEVYFHYIKAAILLSSSEGVGTNFLDTGDYYKGIYIFNNSDNRLRVYASHNTVEQPNGYRLIQGTGENGTMPQYFAPPDDQHDYIPLAEDNWTYGSLWYTIEPSVENGLLDPTKVGSFRWTRCWTIGCCIMHLLKRITNDKVVFSESTDYSQFLYGNPNPVEGHEPFQWLVTQKSNVMRPAAGGASRCPVRLDWFFELLRNAFNCYYWFEKRNDGRYDFRIEHVEYFRRGGAYTPNTQDDPPLDLTRLKPVRNFLRNGQPAKRYADQTNKYTFDLDGMVEKYSYSWQGDGGGDDFKGNPMYFRAGWIEKGSSDDRQVDNIFADLGWLMLNAGTATESSKNYEGLFIFGGYRPMMPDAWNENTAPLDEWMVFSIDNRPVRCDLYITAPEGQQMGINTGSSMITVTGTGTMQHIAMTGVGFDFGTNYTDVVIHRIHARSGNVYRVPNVTNLLRTENTLQNGVLAWPWLQCEYLHYDIPAAKWTYLKDEYTDNPDLVWETDGTIKMVKKQNLAVVPVPDASTEDAIIGIMGVRTGLGTGIIDNTKINLSSRNAEMTIIYDINPQSNQ